MENNSQYIYIDLLHYPLISLGPDIRIGVWLQGCSIHCDGCMSKHTWKKKKENLINIKKFCKEITSINIKNITISGGEPFDQPKALFHLLKCIRNDVEDILVYSGYKYEYIKQNFSYILEYIDVLIDGPFNKTLPTNKIYKGSKNQKIYIFNKKLIDKYLLFMTQTDRNIQIINKNNKMYILGIPHINDFTKIKNNLKDKNG